MNPLLQEWTHLRYLLHLELACPGPGDLPGAEDLADSGSHHLPCAGMKFVHSSRGFIKERAK